MVKGHFFVTKKLIVIRMLNAASKGFRVFCAITFAIHTNQILL